MSTALKLSSSSGAQLRLPTVFALGVAAVLVLTACASRVADGSVSPPTGTVTAAPSPSDDRPRNITGEYICGVSAVSATGDEDRYIGYAIPTLTDGGPREGATGTATFDENGQPIAYTVAAGDNFTSVERRFCTPGFYLEFVNSVRRGTTKLYTGDTLNLSAYTMTTVGDVNGEIRDNPVWDGDESHMPPQR